MTIYITPKCQDQNYLKLIIDHPLLKRFGTIQIERCLSKK